LGDDLSARITSNPTRDQGKKKGARRARRAPRNGTLTPHSPVGRKLGRAPGKFQHSVREGLGRRRLDGRNEPEREALKGLGEGPLAKIDAGEVLGSVVIRSPLHDFLAYHQ